MSSSREQAQILAIVVLEALYQKETSKLKKKISHVTQVFLKALQQISFFSSSPVNRGP